VSAFTNNRRLDHASCPQRLSKLPEDRDYAPTNSRPPTLRLTFFNYFPSKQALLETSSAEMITAYKALLEYELADPARPVRTRLTEITELWAESFAADQEFLAVVVTRTPAFFGASGSMRDEQRATQLLLADLFRQGQQTNEIRPEADPVQLAEVLSAVLLLTTINWLDRWWGSDREPLRDRLLRAAEVVLQGALSSGASTESQADAYPPVRSR
jgi:AcrR family transcriptional regulator